MPGKTFSTRYKAAIVVCVVALALISVYKLSVTKAATETSTALWQSNFSSNGEGFISLGDGKVATVWDGKTNSTFGSYAGRSA